MSTFFMLIATIYVFLVFAAVHYALEKTVTFGRFLRTAILARQNAAMAWSLLAISLLFGSASTLEFLGCKASGFLTLFMIIPLCTFFISCKSGLANVEGLATPAGVVVSIAMAVSAAQILLLVPQKFYRLLLLLPLLVALQFTLVIFLMAALKETVSKDTVKAIEFFYILVGSLGALVGSGVAAGEIAELNWVLGPLSTAIALRLVKTTAELLHLHN